MVESILQKIRKTSNYTLLEYVTVFGADVMDKYYEMQFMKKEQSIRISDKPNMEEYIERLDDCLTLGSEEIVLQVPCRQMQLSVRSWKGFFKR